jgi:hypothetical protein
LIFLNIITFCRAKNFYKIGEVAEEYEDDKEDMHNMSKGKMSIRGFGDVSLIISLKLNDLNFKINFYM